MSIKTRLQRLEKTATAAKEAQDRAAQASGIVAMGPYFTIYRHGCAQAFECHGCGAHVGPRQASALFTGDGHEWRYCDACFGAFLDTYDAYWQERIRRTYALYGEPPPTTGLKMDARTEARVSAHPEIDKALWAELDACEGEADEARLLRSWAPKAKAARARPSVL